MVLAGGCVSGVYYPRVDPEGHTLVRFLVIYEKNYSFYDLRGCTFEKYHLEVCIQMFLVTLSVMLLLSHQIRSIHGIYDLFDCQNIRGVLCIYVDLRM